MPKREFTFRNDLAEMDFSILIDETRSDLITDFGKTTLKDRYLLGGETIQERFAKVAIVNSYDAEHAQRMYDHISQLWFIPATPVLSTSGTNRGYPISCFLSKINDNRESIFGELHEMMWLASKGGGIGTDWSAVRSLNESVGNVGKTSGVIPFMKIQDSCTNGISQGLLRRGSSAAYLHISHPEIEEFVEIRRKHGDPNRRCHNINHGVVIDDKFMEAVRDNTEYDLISPHTKKVLSKVKARELWFKILQTRVEEGEPYLIFEDHVRKGRPDIYKILGLGVTQSNLCVAGDTLITTDKGFVPIAEVVGKKINVWNGVEFSTVVVKKTGVLKTMVQVMTETGHNVICTPSHTFHVLSKKGKNSLSPDAINGLTVVNVADLDFKAVKAQKLRPEHYVVVYDPNTKEPKLAKIRRITPVPGVYDTFCFTEPNRHMGVFNGILAGNCTEIVETTGYDHLGGYRTAVCCLGSINLELWDKWWELWEDQGGSAEFYGFIWDCLTFLDRVLENFIQKAGDDAPFAKSVYSAMRERSIGLGVMGWHSLLQSRGIPFDSEEAERLNKRIFSGIHTMAMGANRSAALKFGPCPDAVDAGVKKRWTHMLAIAPTASISIIGGASPCIEPWVANVFSQKTLSGTFTVYNKYLDNVLDKYVPEGYDKIEWKRSVWSSITTNMGSVQHLGFMSDEDKAVFKTAYEIDQLSIVKQAADRTPYVCQAQSVNVFFMADVDKAYLNKVHFEAWKLENKSMYYTRSLALSRPDVVTHMAGEMPKTCSIDNPECESCQ